LLEMRNLTSSKSENVMSHASRLPSRMRGLSCSCRIALRASRKIRPWEGSGEVRGEVRSCLSVSKTAWQGASD